MVEEGDGGGARPQLPVGRGLDGGVHGHGGGVTALLTPVAHLGQDRRGLWDGEKFFYAT